MTKVDQLIPADANALAAAIHEANVAVGWWDDYLPNNKMARCDRAMMLAISELAEAMEGHRKNLADDHLPHHKMLHVEMTDTAIRLLDLAGAYVVEVGRFKIEMVRFIHLMEQAGEVPEQLYAICREVTGGSAPASPMMRIANSLYAVFAFCMVHDIALAAIITEKLAYNAKRADHRREVRHRPGGKSF